MNQNYYNRNRDYNNNNNNEKYNITQKKLIIDYVNRNVDFSKYRYKLLEFTNHLNYVNNSEYVIPNYNGSNCLIIFVKINKYYYSVIIDKKSIVNRIPIEQIRFNFVKVKLSHEIYNGTIFEGTLLNIKNDRIKRFVINDVYKFLGHDARNDFIKNKLMNVKSYISNNLNDDDNNCELVVNVVYDISKIEELIKIYSLQLKFNRFINGVSFINQISGQKYIYLYKNNNIGNLDHQKNTKPVLEYNNNNKNDNLKHSKNTNPIMECTNNDNNLIFRLKKTNVDVYQLALSEIYKENGKKFVKYKKCGIALIPTYECSLYCKNIFDEKLKQSLLFECNYNKENDKWVPVKYVESGLPDDISKLKK